ncbi:MAG: peptide deformylase [Betaproteobacteria bacterium]|nr:peptide deformylase [Betaproteobacteria bacterium]
MAYLTILSYPDPRLYRKAAPVQSVDDSVRALVRDMADTMYAARGVGLAATQVDVHKRVIVIDISEARDHLLTLINPVIVEKEGTQYSEEGCLSVPGVYDRVERAQRVKIQALGSTGESFELVAEQMLAVCIQHEMDHLEGKVFVDYLSRLKQARIRARMEKQLRKSVKTSAIHPPIF